MEAQTQGFLAELESLDSIEDVGGGNEKDAARREKLKKILSLCHARGRD